MIAFPRGKNWLFMALTIVRKDKYNMAMIRHIKISASSEIYNQACCVIKQGEEETGQNFG